MEEQIKKYLDKVFMLSAILVVGILIFFVGQIILQNKTVDLQNQNQITVSGQGKIYVKPDVALINLGVTTDGLTVGDVTKNNTDKMNAVIAAVKSLGVDEKDIQTTNYSLTPYYDKELTIMPLDSSSSYTATSTKKILKYTLNQNIQVKIRDFTKIGDILSKATSSGSNLIGDLQFTIDNPEQFKDQARAKAIAQAKSNAKDLAKESGISLGKIINVYESSYSPGVMFDSMKAMGAGASNSISVPTIQPGQQEVDVTINLTYKVN